MIIRRSENRDAEIAGKLQKTLDKNPHRRALEIYSLAKDFSRKYLM